MKDLILTNSNKIVDSMKKRLHKLQNIYWFLLCSCIPAIAVATEPTHIQIYQPFTLIPTETIKGECIRHSQRDHRSDAWQCQSGSRTLDPCFIKKNINTHSAICPYSPWQTQSVAVEWTTDKIYSPEETLDVSSQDPWAIDLKDGTHCVKLQQSFLSADNQKLRYSCDNHGFLLGHIQRCELIWRMLFLPSRTSTHMDMVELGNVWF